LYLVPHNTGEALVDFLLMTHTVVPLTLAYSSVTIQRVLSLSILLLAVLMLMFFVDMLSLFLPLPRHEFTHPFGPLTLAAWASARYLIGLLEARGISAARRTRPVLNTLWLFTGIFGGVMHRDYLLSWLLCWIGTEYLISRQLEVGTRIGALAARAGQMSRRVIAAVSAIGVGLLLLMEAAARVLNKPVLSPALRVKRFAEYTVPGLDFIRKNAYLVGHSTKSLPAGYHWCGFGDGFVTLPVGYLVMFNLNVPTLHGALVARKDLLDYMLPGVFVWAFDFGYVGAFLLSLWVGITLYVGSRCLSEYVGRRRYEFSSELAAREALLFGCLMAFSIQSLIGAFLFSRAMNSFALATFTLLSSLIWGHVIARYRL